MDELARDKEVLSNPAANKAAGYSLPLVRMGLLASLLSSGMAIAGETLPTIRDVKHFVVIYMENHSFDNRFGSWEGVNGRIGTYIKQVNQEGLEFECLPQTQKNLVNVPVTCIDVANKVESGFTNQAFNLADYQCDPLLDVTCLNPRDSLTHQFYQEIYQINHGMMNRYVIANDTAGATVSYTETSSLPLYQYLHGEGSAVRYSILDNFFHAAFGGSFLNHQWLIAATSPYWKNAVNDGGATDLHSVVDDNGMPNSAGSNNSYAPPYYHSPIPTQVLDNQLTASCSPAFGRGVTPPNVMCGDYVVNTSQPLQQPYLPGTPLYERVPLQTHVTIGDRLSAKGVSWAWYGGGWSNANGDYKAPGWTNGNKRDKQCKDPAANPNAVFPYCPDKDYSFHHAPFNYFKNFDRRTRSGMANRKRHLRDEVEFRDLVKRSTDKCKLRSVSFVKPIWSETSHSRGGYDLVGDRHLADLVKEVESSICAEDTMVIVTYDENGGEFDHVTPPGQGAVGVFDQWGPGTRVPSMIISPLLGFQASVDSSQYDTTSILATLEERYNLKPVSSRDSAAQSLSGVLNPVRLRPLPPVTTGIP